MYKYTTIMYWSEKNECYIVDVPDLPGCKADGKTPEEAMANVREVISVWIEAAKEDGEPIPEPTFDKYYYTRQAV